MIAASSTQSSPLSLVILGVAMTVAGIMLLKYRRNVENVFEGVFHRKNPRPGFYFAWVCVGAPLCLIAIGVGVFVTGIVGLLA